MKRILVVFLFSSISMALMAESIKPEHIENDALIIKIAESEDGRKGFEQITISLQNNSKNEMVFSGQSFFEDAEGHYNIINLPSKMYPNTKRMVNLRRTYYKSEGQTSFGFTGDFWGITGFELDSSSGWRVSTSDLNVHDIYLTIVFKIGEKVYTNSYHLHN
jgi:hypothetical protein